MMVTLEEHVLDTYAGKQLSQAVTDVYLTLVLEKWTTFRYRLELWPPDVSKSKCWYSHNWLHFLNRTVTLCPSVVIKLLIYLWFYTISKLKKYILDIWCHLVIYVNSWFTKLNAKGVIYRYVYFMSMVENTD